MRSIEVCRTAALGQIALSLGHTLEPPVPSLFTFHIGCEWLPALAGVAVPFTLRAFRIDPALASGILVTTVTDVAGFLFFLGLAAMAITIGWV